MSLKRAIQIARQTRKDIEQHSDFLEDKLGLNFLSDLCGLCAFASRLLHLRLTTANIHSKLIQGSCVPNQNRLVEHAWVEVDGNIIDITATQFGYSQKVRVTKGTPNKLHRTTKKTFRDWSCCQKPSMERIHRFEKYLDKIDSI